MEVRRGRQQRSCASRDYIMGPVVLVSSALILSLGWAPLAFADTQPKLLATIYLRPEAEVTDTSIVLGDLAEIDGHGDGEASKGLAELYVGRAPLPGNSRQIAVGHIEVRLRQAGIHPSAVVLVPPPGGAVKVTTATQEVTADMVTKAVLERLNEDIQEGISVSVDAGDGLPLAVPLGNLELRMGGLPTRPGIFRIGVDIYVDGQRHRTIQARAELSATSSVVSEDRVRDRTQPILVQKGDRVVIEARSGTIIVKALGIALQAGKLGDLIPVENAESRQEVMARIVDSGVVALELYP